MIDYAELNPYAQVPSCTKCPLRGEGYAHPRIHRGSGPKVMFVGEGPGKEEAKQHLAFVGRAGKELDRWIEFLHIDNYFITNIVRHRPTTPDGKKDRPPVESEAKECLPYLMKEIMMEHPDFIIALGNEAVEEAFNLPISISGAIDHFLAHEYYYFTDGTSRMIALFHPSYVLRQKNAPSNVAQKFTMKFMHHLEQVREIVDG